jgi:hypothetical protein
MKKAVAAVYFFVVLAAPLFASQIVLDLNLTLPRPLGGTENVHVTLTAMNNPAVVIDSAGVKNVYTRTATILRITKTEESGGYAHGVSYWINDSARDDVLWGNAGDGSLTLTLPAGAIFKLQVYRTNVVVYQTVSPQYIVPTHIDTTSPTITLSPAPGAYGNTTITATASDSGAGVDATGAVTYSVLNVRTGIVESSGTGTQVTRNLEGIYDLTFTAHDRLGNERTRTDRYTIDYGPPALSEPTVSLEPRADGFMDVSVQFGLHDPGAGVDTTSLSVQVKQQNGSTWSFTPDSLDIVTAPNGDVTATLPVIVVPRPARLGIHVIAADEIGKITDVDDPAYSKVIPPPAVNAEVAITGITALAYALSKNGPLYPRYTIPIRFDRPKSALLSGGVERYRLTRILSASGTVETVMDLPPGEFVRELADQEGYAVYNDILEDARYAHQTISYAIQTFFTLPGSEGGTATGVANLPNIEAWMVHGLIEGEIPCQFLSIDPIYELIMKSFQGTSFQIGPDPEGDTLSMRLEYIRPDGQPGSSPSGGWTQLVSLADVFPDYVEGPYQFRFIINETGNPHTQTSPWFNVIVNSGEITENEVWDVNQTRSSMVTIHSGASLEIAAGVQVTFLDESDPPPGLYIAPGGGIGIVVEPGGRLQMDPGSVIQPTGWTAGTEPGSGWVYWQGIIGQGEVDITSATIRGALRGVVATGDSTVTITGASFVACRTGVHAIGTGANPAISSSSFIASDRYAIKEDEGAVPSVTDSIFSGNAYDYYDIDLTVVDAPGINGLEPPGTNSGNSSLPTSP